MRINIPIFFREDDIIPKKLGKTSKK